MELVLYSGNIGMVLNTFSNFSIATISMLVQSILYFEVYTYKSSCTIKQI